MIYLFSQGSLLVRLDDSNRNPFRGARAHDKKHEGMV